ncbi:MAG: UDP-N-acetylmuramate dehydrogenase [Solobacterium sp.]|nr:UDP-N-acetylmuramate dehydrogenase [Solobacterium sp.]
MSDILELLREFGEVECDIPLSTMTTLRIGGPASYVVYPEDSVSLDALMNVITKHKMAYKVIGKGSNLLCSDKPFHGVVIRLDRFDHYFFMEDTLVAQAGCSIIALAYQAMRNGLSGLEFASGIPATVGGVTFMNAGAYRSSISDVIDGVFIYRNGKYEWLDNRDCEFGYRSSIFQRHPDWIIAAVRIRLSPSDTSEIRELMESRRERRMNSQPLNYPSAGSVFRNPDDIPAWKLIEGIGFRGKRIGDAMVSEKHVNFIVNAGNASAEDFLTLVNEIKDQVEQKYQVRLHMEVEKFNW